MSPYERLQSFISKQQEHAVNELEVDTHHRTLYHISPNPNIPVFVPREIQRTMDGEDESVKRVCTGITIIDCLRGYGVALRDFMDSKAHCAGKDEWLGGYTIYALSVEGSLRPTKVVCPMAEWSEERWLVNVDTEDQRYPSRVVGKCFIDELRVIKDDYSKAIETRVLIQVDSPSIKFSPFFNLKRGFYRMIIPALEKYKEEPFDQSQVEMFPLSESEFNQAKERKAGLLSYEFLNLSKIVRW